MMTYLIIVGALVLLLIGATQRKKLFILFKSKTNDLIDKNTNQVSVIKLQIVEMRKNVESAINDCCDLAASEEGQYTQINSIKEKIKENYNKAKKAKDKGESDKSKVFIELAMDLEVQVKELEKNAEVIKASVAKLEVKIAKAISKITSSEVSLKNLKARKKTNDALNKVTFGGTNGSKLNDTLDTLDIEVSHDEIALDKKLSFSDEVDVDFDESVNAKFNEI